MRSGMTVQCALAAMLSWSSLTLAAEPSTAEGAAEKAFRDVIANPTDPETLKALKAVLPKLGEYYLVEGDRRLTEDQLRVYVAQLATSATSAAPRSGELLVHVANGKPARWCEGARVLTYAIDRGSFEKRQYETVVNNVAAAARAWESACKGCGITFAHKAALDASPSHENVVFIVKGVDTGESFIATAFFPSDPPSERFVYVDTSYFETEFDQVGVFRHELGHVLGYRHEHIRDVPGCYWEDGAWIALGAYDAQSALHYPCGGGGSGSFVLSASDRKSHQIWYTEPDGGRACTPGVAAP